LCLEGASLLLLSSEDSAERLDRSRGVLAEILDDLIHLRAADALADEAVDAPRKIGEGGKIFRGKNENIR
jgi:hypothetical protein